MNGVRVPHLDCFPFYGLNLTNDIKLSFTSLVTIVFTEFKYNGLTSLYRRAGDEAAPFPGKIFWAKLVRFGQIR